jgi:hypothetical protein
MPMSMAECVFPEDTSKLISITDGTRWFYNVIPNSIRVDHARNAQPGLHGTTRPNMTGAVLSRPPIPWSAPVRSISGVLSGVSRTFWARWYVG